MKNFWRKQKQNILILGLPILIFAAVFLLIIPQKEKINKQAEDVQKMIADHEAREKKISELERMRQQYDLIKINDGNMGVLFSSDRVVEVIEKLEKIAQESENIIFIEIEDEAKKTAIKTTEKDKNEEILRPLSEDYIKMNIRLEGSYRNLVEFINKIENADYYADISSVQTTVKKPISAGQSSSFINPFTADINTDPEKKEEKIKDERGDVIVYSNIGVVFYKKMGK
jgi:hypothetical protein